MCSIWARPFYVSHSAQRTRSTTWTWSRLHSPFIPTIAILCRFCPDHHPLFKFCPFFCSLVLQRLLCPLPILLSDALHCGNKAAQVGVIYFDWLYLVLQHLVTLVNLS